MSVLSRTGFVDRYQGKSLSVQDDSAAARELRAQGMDDARLARADLNGDGKIRGTSEVGALFREVDHFDRNGQLASVDLTASNGEATQPGRIVSTLDLLFQAHEPSVGTGTFEIVGTVGSGRSNRHDDVTAVQERLLELGFKIDVDGDFGGQTKNALQVYEAMLRGVDDSSSMSGSLRPGSPLHKAMKDPDAPKWVALPRSGTGFVNQDWDGFGHGSQILADVIVDAAKKYHDGHQGSRPNISLLALNDASIRNGGDNRDHATHENGLDLDVRLPTTNGEHGTTVTSRNYDRKTAFAMIESFASDPRVTRIFQSDPQIVAMARGKSWANKLVHGGSVHRNHFHVDVRPPESTYNR